MSFKCVRRPVTCAKTFLYSLEEMTTILDDWGLRDRILEPVRGERPGRATNLDKADEDAGFQRGGSRFLMWLLQYRYHSQLPVSK